MEQQELLAELRRRIQQLDEELGRLRGSERRYRTVFQTAPEVMLVTDTAGNILSANATALRASGYTREEVGALTIFQLLSPQASDRLRGQFDEVIKGAEPAPAQYEFLRKDGSKLLVELELRLLREGLKPVAVHCVARDAAAKKSAEDALKCSRENLERVLNGLSDAVLVENPDHAIRFVNNAARSLFGDAKGKSCYEVLKGLEQPYPNCAVEEIIENRRSIFRTTYCHEDKVWELTGIPLLNPDGSASVLEVIKDVTTTREVDEKRKVSERLAALGRVASEMAHEIKNPLSAITTFAQLLPEKYDDEEFRQVFTRSATQAVSKINYLMEELVNFARPIKPVLEEADLREVIEEALTEIQQDLATKRVRVSKDISPEPLFVRVDREQVKQVIRSLLSNSLAAVKEEGSIRVSARVISDEGEEPIRKVQLVVSDDGIGIPPENLKRVFEPFFTTSSDKLGLGLTTAQRIIEEHDGTIEVKSQPGQGATFVVMLRTAATHESPQDSPDPRSS